MASQVQLELADKTPINVGPNQAQILIRKDADIEVMEENLKKYLDDVETLTNGAHAPVTRERMAMFQTMITKVLETVRGPVSELFDQRVKEDPTQAKTTTRSKREFINTIQRRANGLKVGILMKFNTEVAKLEQHMPWKLEVKAADGLRKENGRVINAPNIHNEDNFGKQG
jgi:hypothetical protein